ncbi:MAG: hypothetical protein ABW034_02930 [Steroidobacteraceae bacterium]
MSHQLIMGHRAADVATSWQSFCERIREIGNEMLQLEGTGSPERAAETLLFATRVLRGALEGRLDGFDSEYPRLMWWDRITAGSAPVAPNVDNSYVVAKIDGRQTYRLRIRLGSFDEVNISAHCGVYGEAGFQEKSRDVTLRDMTIADGHAELILSNQAQQGRGLEIPAAAKWLFIRIYYYDWEKGAPPEVTLSCTSVHERPPNSIPASHLMQGLHDAAEWLRNQVLADREFTQHFFGRANGKKNVFFAASHEAAGPPAIRYGGAEFELAPNEALITEFEVPKAPYWIIQWHRKPWGDSADFFNHITSLNHLQARRDADGKVRIVFAHEDPGIQNWISTERRSTGIIYTRWFWSETVPVPIGKVVPFAEVRAHLPAETPAFSPDQRARQLAIRRAHLARRY